MVSPPKGPDIRRYRRRFFRCTGRFHYRAPSIAADDLYFSLPAIAAWPGCHQEVGTEGLGGAVPRFERSMLPVFSLPAIDPVGRFADFHWNVSSASPFSASA